MESDYISTQTILEDLQKEYDELFEKHEKLKTVESEERKLNNELIEINRKVAEASNKTAEIYMKYERENTRMKNILKHGIFVEYNKDPATIEFVPVLGDITSFKQKQEKPTKMMYTFTINDIQGWLDSLHDLMNGKNIIKIDPKDLKS